MKLFLIRHGESTANVERRFAGQTDSPLTPLGIEQAVAIRDVLGDIPFEKVYSSDLSRAHDTQKNALPGMEAQLTPLLREYDVGTWSGKLVADAMQAVKGGRINYADYGGEDFEMVAKRVADFFAMLEADPHEYVAAFSHGGFVMNAVQYVLGVSLERGKFSADNCAIQVFEYKNGTWSVLSWNYMRPVLDPTESIEKMGVLA